MKIVLGGSRFLEKIPHDLVALLREWNNSGFYFLIGDASGADSAFQRELNKMDASRVTVYSSAGYVRNNFGNWESKEIETGLISKSNSSHAFKDRVMTALADQGLMLWDCSSAGTLSNVIDLVEQGKTCKVWVAPDAELNSFDNQESLDKWLMLYPKVTIEARRRLNTYRRRESKRSKVKQPLLFD